VTVVEPTFVPLLVELSLLFRVEAFASIDGIVLPGDPIGFDPMGALAGVGEGMLFPAVGPRFCEELFTLAAWLLLFPLLRLPLLPLLDMADWFGKTREV